MAMEGNGGTTWGKAELEERLKSISQALIDAYRAKDREFLRLYASQAGIAPGLSDAPLNRLFGRVIQIFHPDRIASAMEKMGALGPGAESFFTFRKFDARGRSVDSAPEGGGRGFEAWREREEFAYGREDFGYSEEESGYGSEESRGYGEEDPDMTDGPMDILEAIKRAYLGNLDGYPSPLELEMLEGELDLSGMVIDDAEGAQWLKSLSSLNLSGNRLDNCGPLSHMARLEYLDLSDNLMEDADPLAGLEFLSELDLSGNEIDDFSFLEELPSLQYVNLTGNPPLPPNLRDRLEKKGIIVIQ